MDRKGTLPNDTLMVALIPAWNEAARIGAVIEATRAHLPVLVVDDGSTDETFAAAEAAGAAVVRHAWNRGKGAALATGFAWAMERGCEAVVTLDADGQHDPEEIAKFRQAFAGGAGDLVIGRRDFSRMPFPRSIVNPLGSWLLSRALGMRIYDNQSGYRLYGRRFLQALEPAYAGFAFEVDAIVQAVCLGTRIGWVDIRTIYDADRVSRFRPVRDTARFLLTVWRAWRRRKLT